MGSNYPYLDMLVKDGFSISDGLIMVPGVTNPRDIQGMADELREVVLSYKLPHWKAIGATIVAGSGIDVPDYITKGKGVSRSYAELLKITRDLVIKEGGGVHELMGNVDDLDDYYQYTNAAGLSCLTTISSKVESSNGSIVYDGSGLQPIESLIEDVPIIEFERDSMAMRLLMYFGTGIVGFKQAAEIINVFEKYITEKTGHQTQLAPISQVYDLTTFFTVKNYMPGDEGVQLFYKRPVNEEVLGNIIMYGICNM